MSAGLQIVGRRSTAPPTVRAWGTVVLLAVLAPLGLLLLARRLAGAFDRPLEFPTLVLLALVLALLRAAACRLMGNARPYWLTACFDGALLMAGAAVSVPGSSGLGLAAFWGVVAAAVGYAWRPRPAAGKEEAQAIPVAPPAEPLGLAPSEPLDQELVEEMVPDDVVQQFTRRQLGDGTELVEGWLRVVLVPGQANANAHLGFCPPLARAPELTCEQVSGPAARIKLPQVLPHGARLDLKLARPADTPQAIVLQFSARAK